MPSPNVAVVGIPNAWSTEVLSAALRELGVNSFVVPLYECSHDVTGNAVRWRDHDLGQLDGIMVKKIGDLDTQYVENRLVMLRELERAGVMVASKPAAVDAAVNRYRNTWLLRQAGVPIPRTVLTESIEAAETVVERWGRVVLKPLFTTHARGMQLLRQGADNGPALQEFQESGRGPFYLQEFIEAPGRDIAVMVMGNQVIGAYCRVAAPGHWKTTTADGGHYEAFDLPADLGDLALVATRAFGLEFTSVDFVETPQGWLAYEVSAFGGFSGLKKACNIDAAALYAQHFLKKLSNERN